MKTETKNKLKAALQAAYDDAENSVESGIIKSVAMYDFGIELQTLDPEAEAIKDDLFATLGKILKP